MVEYHHRRHRNEREIRQGAAHAHCGSGEQRLRPRHQAGGNSGGRGYGVRVFLRGAGGGGRKYGGNAGSGGHGEGNRGRDCFVEDGGHGISVPLPDPARAIRRLSAGYAW